MRMFDIIAKKRDGHELSREEIAFFVKGYTQGEIPDYQASSLLMAIYIQGMTKQETCDLTLEMAASGDTIDLSAIEGVKVDKHSTGGVGDKTTLVVAPIVASLGVKIAKMSGRGLGHTGGTLDKLEAIPGFNIAIAQDEFFDIVNKHGLSLVGQTGNLGPADKKIYALRDVTATVASTPLIASSIMSKKIAAGADKILLDVKVGSGAFMKTVDDAIELAQEMVEIGSLAKRDTVALITDMDRPLGSAIGNALEVQEVIDVLHGEGPTDLRSICIELAANMYHLGMGVDIDEARAQVAQQMDNEEGFEKLRELVAAQGGDVSVIDNPELFKQAEMSLDVVADRSGYICEMDAERVGMAGVALGAGRAKKEDGIDYSAGIKLYKKLGDKVCAHDVIATLYANDQGRLDEAHKIICGTLAISDTPYNKPPLVYARVSKDGVEIF